MPDYAPESVLDDEISLRPYFETVWRYRSVIGLSLAGMAIVLTLLAATLYLSMPKERIASVGVRFLFTGAERGKYPNGTPFNASEIVSSAVLNAVYASNDLKRYASVEQLQQSLSVSQTNQALQQLDFDYQARLSDTKLTPVDRDKLAAEFTQKRGAIRVPEFTLNLYRRERLGEMPDVLVEKVLSDLLEIWAKQADTEQGAARPDIDVVSRDVFARAGVASDSFLVRVDILRTGSQRLVAALTELQNVPGARAVRTTDGHSLGDELTSVENILKFDVEPLMGMARLTSERPQDRLVLSAYLTNQLDRYRLDLRAANTRAQTLQTSLRDYMAQRGSRVDDAATPVGTKPLPPAASASLGVPQLTDSFIDRLMEMSAASQSTEVEYRRDLTNRFIAANDDAAVAEREIGYYENLLNQFSTPSSVGGAVGADLVSRRLAAAFDALNQSVDRVQKLYDAISIQTLNPSRRLYTITQPLGFQTVTSVRWRTVVVAFVMTMMLTLILAIIACLVHKTYRSTPVRQFARSA